MEAVTMRQKLHQCIDMGDEKLLKIMYQVAKEYNDEFDDASEHVFTGAELKLFVDRRNKRLRGESKTYSWVDAKNIITGKSQLNNVALF